jgi:hypothetical protein
MWFLQPPGLSITPARPHYTEFMSHVLKCTWLISSLTVSCLASFQLLHSPMPVRACCQSKKRLLFPLLLPLQ